jgi:hypothetical protein
MTEASKAPTARTGRTGPTVGAAIARSAQVASALSALMVSAHFDHAPTAHSDRVAIDHSGLVASDPSDPAAIVRRRAVHGRATRGATIGRPGMIDRGAARRPSPDPKTGATSIDPRIDHRRDQPIDESIAASIAHSNGRVAVPHRVAAGRLSVARSARVIGRSARAQGQCR